MDNTLVTRLFTKLPSGGMLFVQERADGTPDILEEGEGFVLRDRLGEPVRDAWSIQRAMRDLGLTAVPKGAKLSALKDYTAEIVLMDNRFREGRFLVEDLEWHLTNATTAAQAVGAGFEAQAAPILDQLRATGYAHACEWAIVDISSEGGPDYGFSDRWRRDTTLDRGAEVPTRTTRATEVCRRLPSEQQPALRGKMADVERRTYGHWADFGFGLIESAIQEKQFAKLPALRAQMIDYAQRAGTPLDTKRLDKLFRHATKAVLAEVDKAAQKGIYQDVEQFAAVAQRLVAPKQHASTIATINAALVRGYQQCATQQIESADRQSSWRPRDAYEHTERDRQIMGAVAIAQRCATKSNAIKKGSVALDQRRIDALIQTVEQSTRPTSRY